MLEAYSHGDLYRERERVTTGLGEDHFRQDHR
jgi:hypothetical protein